MPKYIELTEEQKIAQHYKSMLDSVALIESYAMQCPDFLDEEERSDAIGRNVSHLELMKAKDFWTTEDMTPVNTAIATGNAYLA